MGVQRRVILPGSGQDRFWPCGGTTALFRRRLPAWRRSMDFSRRHKLGHDGADAGFASSCGQFNIQRANSLALTVMVKRLAKGRWYSTARVSKRLIHRSTACLRARYCTDLAWPDLVRRPLLFWMRQWKHAWL